MTQGEVIARLCKLATKVGEEVFKNLRAHDCFCGDNGESGLKGSKGSKGLDYLGGFQFEEEVIAYIEQAVSDKMKKARQAR